MKRIRHPKRLLAAVLLLAVAVGTFVAWRAGWFAGHGYSTPRDRDLQLGGSFRLAGDETAVYHLANWPSLKLPVADDFGEKLGTAISDNPLIDGGTVWRANRDPARLTLFIAEWQPYGPLWFYRDTPELPTVAEGETPEAVFSAFGLPEDAEEGVCGYKPLGKAQVERLLTLLSSLENAGEAAREAAFAAAEAAGEDPALDAREVRLSVWYYNLRLTYYPVLRGVLLAGGWYPVTEDEAAALHKFLYYYDEERDLATLAPREA